jgi:catechol 2,3-dioxygenase-like lactoylglutathione lyase family enzyme
MEPSMLAKQFSLAVVVLAVGGIIAVKVGSRAGSPPAGPAGGGLPPASTDRPSVVLVADMREADTECGCGQIIRRVQAAKAHGVVVKEVAPDDTEAGRRYGVTVVPTVVFLDPKGHVIARREGESSETMAAVAADLARLEEARR